jgi:protein O-GlcNAc transferase
MFSLPNCWLTFTVILAGLGRLVAKSENEYVSLALDLAADVTALQELRMSLRGLMAKSPVCDGENFTRGLESAYRNMWRRYCDGDAPALRRLDLLQEEPCSNNNKQDFDDNQVAKLADLKAQRVDAAVDGDKQSQLTAHAAVVGEVQQAPIMVNGVSSPVSSGKVEANGHISR